MFGAAPVQVGVVGIPGAAHGVAASLPAPGAGRGSFFVGSAAAVSLVVAMRDVLPRANGRSGMFQRRAQAPDERLQAAWDRARRQVLTMVIAVGMIGGLVAVATTYLTGEFAITVTPARVNAGVLAALLLGLVPVAVLAWSDRAEPPDSDAVRFTGPAVVPAPPAAGRPYRLLIGLLTIAPLFVFMVLTTYQESRSWTVALTSGAVIAIAISLLMPWLIRRVYARRRNQIVDPPTPLASEPRP